MQRLLVRAGVWLVATGSSVTLSWFGVHTVLRGTVYDPPRAVPVRDASAWAEPDASSTHRPPQDPSAPPPATGPAPGTSAPAGSQSPAPDEAGPEPEAGPEAEPGPDPGPDGGAEEPADPPPDAAGRVETVTLEGGRVVYDLGAERCELVSATPEPGWEMQVWTTESYLRVTFAGHGRELSAFCTWHGYEPAIEVHEG